MPSPIRRILVPIDFSDSAREALRFATQLAESLDAEIRALHVIATAEAVHGEEGGPAARERASKDLALLVKSFEAPESVRIVRDVVVGDPIKTILQACAECDLVLMGRHGHTGLMHRLMGSVTEHVLRDAKCPVLTVRPSTPPAASKP